MLLLQARHYMGFQCITVVTADMVNMADMNHTHSQVYTSENAFLECTSGQLPTSPYTPMNTHKYPGLSTVIRKVI